MLTIPPLGFMEKQRKAPENGLQKVSKSFWGKKAIIWLWKVQKPLWKSKTEIGWAQKKIITEDLNAFYDNLQHMWTNKLPLFEWGQRV